MSRRVGVSLEDLRRNNVSRLLSRVHISGQTSRASLTRELGLNRSTIGDLVGELAELGLVAEEQSTGDGRSGRPSLLVSPRQENCVIAVNLEVDRICVALVALGGAVLTRRERAHERGEHDVEHVIESVAQMVEEVLRSSPAGTRCLAVGVAVPGAIGGPNRMVRFAPNLGWVDAPFEEQLGKRLGMLVVTGNDAKLGALAEHIRGVAIGYTEVAYVSGGVGIGGGFLIGGQQLSGVGGYAGEVGHLLVDNTGPTCRCGGVGCWETKVGENQLLVSAGRLRGGGPAAVDEVVQAAIDGEDRANEALDNTAQWLGIGLRAVINVFNPEILVLGGTLAKIWKVRQNEVDAVLARESLMSPREDLLITAARLGIDSPMIGAAELAFAPVLADPVGAVADLARIGA